MLTEPTYISPEALRALPLFAALDDHELAWLADKATLVHFAEGEALFHEGEPDPHFFVLLHGKLDVIKRAAGGHAVWLTSHDQPGQFTGELPLLLDSAYMATVTAAEPTTMVRFDKDAFCRLITYPSVTQQLMPVLATRIHAIENMLQQRQKLAALGQLAAGLAHELNNPAAAASRSANQLYDILPALQPILLRSYRHHLTEAQREQVNRHLTDVLNRERTPDPDPIALADLEDDISLWFAEHNIMPGWNTASSLAAIGVDRTWLDSFACSVAADLLDDLLRWTCITLEMHSLLDLVGESSSRISELVKAVKGYSYMDRAPVQDIDVHDGLESTIAVLGYKLGGITVTRDYAEDLPLIPALGSELNQVWTNLIENAAEALSGKGTITLTTYHDNDHVVVEITDNGPGIPEEMQDRVFEPFFTTKPVGAGAGLGLDICYGIVVNRHHGDIHLESHPGGTRLRVRLPVTQM
jgi:signal transduction histidine kinase